MTIGERPRRLAVALLVIGLCSYVLLLLADTALHKQFWVDEGFEVIQVCERPAAAMLARGSFGCSPAPLFSIAHRLVVRSVEPLGLPIRLTYRAVSLAAATLALLVLLFGLRHRLGLTAALIAFATLVTDPVFHHYAEQNRAYITWLMATAVLVVATAELSMRGEMRLRNRLALLLCAGLLAGLSATPGCAQAAGAFAAFWLFQRLAHPSAPLGRKAAWALLWGAAVIIALDVYYWSGSICRGWGGAAELGLDLMAGRQRPGMVRNALAPLWPPATSPWVWLARAAMLVGMVAPLAFWRRRPGLAASERYALALWLTSLAQIAIALPVALSLIASHYLFLPRMFIFTLVPRAALTALGFWIAGRALHQAARGAAWARATTVGLSTLTAAAALWHADRIGRQWHFPFPPTGDITCSELQVPELRLLKPVESLDAFTLNFLVRLGRALDSCAATPRSAAAPRYLLALDATNQADWFRVAGEAPAGFEPLEVCGEPVTLKDGRFRR